MEKYDAEFTCDDHWEGYTECGQDIRISVEFNDYTMPDIDFGKDAERFNWLINRGVAWRDCYDGVWKQGEWLYIVQNARKQIDEAMGKDNKENNRT